MKALSLSIAAIFFSTLTIAKPIDLQGEAQFTLKGDYFAAKSQSNKGVLMLHQCNFNRSMYNDIGTQLANEGVHALSMDFRGYGESVDSRFDVKKVRALPQNDRGAAWQTMTEHWGKDVLTAYNYLKDKVGNNGEIAVIGASCGGSQAIALSEVEDIKAIGFFSSAQREANIARYTKGLAQKPTLVIAAEEDGLTYTSAQTLFKEAKNAQSKFIVYKGREHGYPLLDSDPNLTQAIVTWFKHQL